MKRLQLVTLFLSACFATQSFASKAVLCPTMDNVKSSWQMISTVEALEQPNSYIGLTTDATLIAEGRNWYIGTSPIKASNPTEALSKAQLNVKSIHAQVNDEAFEVGVFYVCGYHSKYASVTVLSAKDGVKPSVNDFKR